MSFAQLSLSKFLVIFYRMWVNGYTKVSIRSTGRLGRGMWAPLLARDVFCSKKLFTEWKLAYFMARYSSFSDMLSLFFWQFLSPKYSRLQATRPPVATKVDLHLPSKPQYIKYIWIKSLKLSKKLMSSKSNVMTLQRTHIEIIPLHFYMHPSVSHNRTNVKFLNLTGINPICRYGTRITIW